MIKPQKPVINLITIFNNFKALILYCLSVFTTMTCAAAFLGQVTLVKEVLISMDFVSG